MVIFYQRVGDSKMGWGSWLWGSWNRRFISSADLVHPLENDHTFNAGLPGQVHPLSKCEHVAMASIKGRILVQIYGSHCLRKKSSIKCPLCDGPEAIMAHFLHYCQPFRKWRNLLTEIFKPFFKSFISSYIQQIVLCMQAILDPSSSKRDCKIK